MNCNAAKSHLYAYVDGELAPDRRQALERHLAGCEGCRRLAELEVAFQEAYVRRLRPDPAPETLRARVREVLAALPPRLPARRRRWRRRVGLGAAALALLAAGAGLGLGIQSYLASRRVLVQLAEAAVEQHQRLVREELPADVRGVSPQQAADWFRQRLPFNVQLPDLQTERLTFVGGRISHLRGVEAAALEYRVEGRYVSLFIIPEDAYARLGVSDKPRFKTISHRGYDVTIWRSHGAGYALVSEIGGRSCQVCHAEGEPPGAGPAGPAHQ
jgi:anti-sigma factor (TIGR02949 family)